MSNSKQKDDEILTKLEHFFNGGYKTAGIRMLPDNYFFIEDILQLEQFANFEMADVHNAVHSDGKLRFSVRGSKIRVKPPELNKDRDVIISKKLAWLLRHGAEKEGFELGEGGYIYVDEMLSHSEFDGINVDDLERVINANDKRRFELRPEPGSQRLQVRASQGHSVQVQGLELKEITASNAHRFPIVVHGTYFKNWRAIVDTGLNRMGRNHIHFAPGEVGDDGVISGMRSSAEVLIYIDIALAIQDGIKFHLSNNQVILSEGDANGKILPKYFTEVYQRRPRQLLYRKGDD